MTQRGLMRSYNAANLQNPKVVDILSLRLFFFWTSSIARDILAVLD